MKEHHTISATQMRQIVEVLREHGVAHAALFGSYARGEASDRSDVDILVEFAGAVGLLDVADLELALTDLLDQPVEVITYRALNPRIRDAVLREQVAIL